MRNKKLKKKVLLISLSATMVFAIGSSAYANTPALPNGTIITQNGTKFLTDSKGEKYSDWFIDSKEDWYYFNESDKTMKTGWHHDNKDGYWYYLNLSDGKMVTGWQSIDGKEYFFQPVRDVGNYHFNSEQEKWLYSVNSKVPYGAMYVNTTTPDGSKVGNTGAKQTSLEQNTTDNKSNTIVTDSTQNGWVSNGGKWYYYESGTLAKEKWLNLNGTWYYVTGDGSMDSNGWKTIGGKAYYFGSDGGMYVNRTTPDGSKVDGNGVKVVVDYSSYVGLYIGEWALERYRSEEEYWLNEGYLHGDLESFLTGPVMTDVLRIYSINDGMIKGYRHSGDSQEETAYDYDGKDFSLELEEDGSFTLPYKWMYNGSARDEADEYGYAECYFRLSERSGENVIIEGEGDPYQNVWVKIQ